MQICASGCCTFMCANSVSSSPHTMLTQGRWSNHLWLISTPWPWTLHRWFRLTSQRARIYICFTVYLKSYSIIWFLYIVLTMYMHVFIHVYSHLHVYRNGNISPICFDFLMKSVCWPELAPHLTSPWHGPSSLGPGVQSVQLSWWPSCNSWGFPNETWFFFTVQHALKYKWVEKVKTLCLADP